MRLAILVLASLNTVSYAPSDVTIGKIHHSGSLFIIRYDIGNLSLYLNLLKIQCHYIIIEQNASKAVAGITSILVVIVL